MVSLENILAFVRSMLKYLQVKGRDVPSCYCVLTKMREKERREGKGREC